MTDQPTKEQLEAILDTVFECGWEAGERYKEAKGGTTDVSDTLFKAKQDITALIQEASNKSSECLSPNCDNRVGGYCAECERLWQT